MERLALTMFKKCSLLSISRFIVSHDVTELYCDDASLITELGYLSEDKVSALMPILANMLI